MWSTPANDIWEPKKLSKPPPESLEKCPEIRGETKPEWVHLQLREPNEALINADQEFILMRQAHDSEKVALRNKSATMRKLAIGAALLFATWVCWIIVSQIFNMMKR